MLHEIEQCLPFVADEAMDIQRAAKLSIGAQFAVDGDVEQRQIAHGAGKLSLFACPVASLLEDGRVCIDQTCFA